LPARLKRALLGHSVKTVPEAGWRSSKDGPLLKFAERNFDVFVTIDQKMEREHALPGYRLGFIILHVRTNRLIDFQHIVPQIAERVGNVSPGEVVHIRSPL
jgi:hypothetical protein